MTDQAEQVVALTKAVNTMDSSRRVGWASYYEANETADQALRDLNVARGDLAAMTHFAAFCYGITVAMGTDHLIDKEFPQAVSYLPAGPINEGQQRLGLWRVGMSAHRIAKAKRRAEALRDESTTEFEHVRRKIMAKLARRHGIRDEEELEHWLSQYPTKRNRP